MYFRAKLVCGLGLVFLQGCTTLQTDVPAQNEVLPVLTTAPAEPGLAAVDGLLFSGYPAASALPLEWVPIRLPNKRSTEYRLITQDRRTVLHAHAVKSASGIRKKVAVNASHKPWLRWSWKVNTLVAKANNGLRSKEDSPVRIVLSFAGDKSKLSFREQVISQQAKLMTSEELPYATLMYIWENQQPVGAIIDNLHTGRVKMVVASSGAAGVGQWQQLSRNFAEDFRRAFGEAPGDLISVGVMTDTDNTATEVEAYYGDLYFESTETQ